MNILKIGVTSTENYQRRVLAIASGKLKPQISDPKIWFNSLDAVAEVLSTANIKLLKIIISDKPKSISQLAELAEMNSRTVVNKLELLSRYEIVEADGEVSRDKIPKVKATEFRIQYSVV